MKSKLFAVGVRLTFFFLLSSVVFADYRIDYEIDRDSHEYAVGEEAAITVQVYDQDELSKEGVLSVTFTNDGRNAVAEPLEFNVSESNPVSIKGKLDFPGFLQINLKYTPSKEEPGTSKLIGLAFDPTKIEPGLPAPDDFDSFWEDGKAETRNIPIDLEQEKIENLSNETRDVYRVSFATVNDRRVYGFLTIPKKGQAPFPAIVNVPGAGPGVGPETWLANEGFVVLTMNVFPYHVGLTGEERQKQYDDYNKSLGQRYCYANSNDRNAYFFRSVYLGIDRAVDWLAEQDYVDETRIGVYGSSQGGASALILGGLNSHFCSVLSAVPALCDHNGYLKGRSPGWPRLVDTAKTDSEQVADAARYLDSVNFARKIDVPITVTVGFIDIVCSPSSVYSAYNSIPSKNKRILHEPLLGHQNKQKFSDAFVEFRNNLKESRQTQP